MRGVVLWGRLVLVFVVLSVVMGCTVVGGSEVPATEVVPRASVGYCDDIAVCQGGICGANSQGGCCPDLRVWGHSSDGGDVAFRVLLRDEQGERVLGDSFRTTAASGYYRWVGGLVSAHCDGALVSSVKDPGPPYSSCEFSIWTYGAGGYSLTQYLDYQTRVNSLAVFPAITYTIQALVSPVVTERTPDGYFLHREATGDWNWDDLCQTKLKIWYEMGRWRCQEVAE